MNNLVGIVFWSSRDDINHAISIRSDISYVLAKLRFQSSILVQHTRVLRDLSEWERSKRWKWTDLAVDGLTKVDVLFKSARSKAFYGDRLSHWTRISSIFVHFKFYDCQVWSINVHFHKIGPSTLPTIF